MLPVPSPMSCEAPELVLNSWLDTNQPRWSSPVIGAPLQDRLGAVELLEQQQPRQFMGKRHR